MLSEEDLVRQNVNHEDPVRRRVEVVVIDSVFEHVEVTDGEK